MLLTSQSVVLAGSSPLRNGEPFFPIGIYRYPEGLPVQPRFEELANAGFNTVLLPLATPLEVLDGAWEYGIGVVATLGWNMILDPEGEESKKAWLEENIERVRDHPAILGYEAPDEIAWVDYLAGDSGGHLEGVLRGYDYVKSLDPGHPVYMNHGCRNSVEYLKSYSEGADILGTDIYPVPGGERHSDLDQSLNCVGQYTDKLEDVGEGKPIYMVLQGAGWEDILGYEYGKGSGPQPNWLETRFMAYDAVCHGANGIIYWGLQFTEVEDELWQHLKRMATELRSLTPLLLDGTFESTPPIDPSLEEHFKVHDGWHYLVVLNTKDENLGEVEVRLPPGWRGDNARVLFENRSIEIGEGMLPDFFLGHEVHIYTDDPRPDIILEVENPELVEEQHQTNISVTLRNSGWNPAPSFNLTLIWGEEELAHALVQGLELSSHCSVDLKWTPTDRGNLTLRVEVDPSHALGERSWADNIEFFTALSGRAQADLRATGLPVLDSGIIYSKVSNAGLAVAGGFNVSCEFGGIDLPCLDIDGLLPGESITVSWPIPPGASGPIPCEVTVDCADEVDEMLEGNNKALGTIYALDEECYTKVGGATYPRELLEDEPWVIRYDPSEGEIPTDSGTITLVWGINGWKHPAIYPMNSLETERETDSPMSLGSDGLWYVTIPNQEARTLSFRFRADPDSSTGSGPGTSWDDNQGEDWEIVRFAQFFRSGPAVYPQDLSDNGLWVIKYDPAKGTGTIPQDSDTCTLVWTINDGEYPRRTPQDSQNVNGSCETPMSMGSDGLWNVTIPNQEARTLNFRFRADPDSSTGSGAWDDNQGRGWRTAASTYVQDRLAELGRVIDGGEKYGANMSVYSARAARAWSSYIEGDYSQALYDIDDDVTVAGIQYVRQLLEFASGQLGELIGLGFDPGLDEELLQRAGDMLDRGIYRGAELYCETVLQHISEYIPESLGPSSILLSLAAIFYSIQIVKERKRN